MFQLAREKFVLGLGFIRLTTASFMVGAVLGAKMGGGPGGGVGGVVKMLGLLLGVVHFPWRSCWKSSVVRSGNLQCFKSPGPLDKVAKVAVR